MNQGKLEVVKQEILRVNMDILGISELKWNGMVEFNSDDHYIYYCGQESLRRNGVATMVNKRVQIQPYAPTSNAEETEVERFYEDLQDLSELTPKKDVLFIIGDWNAKVGSQETPGVTGKFGLGIWNEAGQRLNRVLPRERTGHSKHLLPTTQEKTLHMDITRWSTPKSD